MSDSFIQASYYLLSHSMSSDPSILLNYINMITAEDFITILKNCGVYEEVIEQALTIKNNILVNNLIDHQVVIDLFKKYDYDVENDHQIDMKKIILLINTKIDH